MQDYRFSKQPFCLVACGRSGSTLLYRMLREHSRIAMTNEAKILDFLIGATTYLRIPAQSVHAATGWQGMLNEEYIPVCSAIYHAHARAALEEFYEAYFRDKEFTHFGDKLLTLSHPAGLPELFPEVKVIVLVRDARDVVCSTRSFARRDDVRATAPRVARLSVQDHAEEWRRIYASVLDDLPSYHLVRYEALIRRPREELSRVLRFLGLAFEPDCLAGGDDEDFFVNHATSASPDASAGRWKRDLAPRDLAAVERVCGPVMTRFGYVPAGKTAG